MTFIFSADKVADPSIPSKSGSNLLPFTSNRIQISAWHTAGVKIPINNVEVLFEFKSVLFGVKWKQFQVQGKISSNIGFIEYLSDGWPEQISKRDEEGDFSYRARITAAHGEEVVEHVILFGRARLPIEYEKLALVDPDNFQHADYLDRSLGTREFSPQIKQMNLELFVRSPLLNLNGRIRIYKRFSNQKEPILDQTFKLTCNTHQIIPISSLPSDIAHSPTGRWAVEYRAKIEFEMEKVSRFKNLQFSVLSKEPPGEIKINNVALSNVPFYDYTNAVIEFDDTWEHVILSVELSTNGYNPKTEPVNAQVTFYFKDQGNEGRSWEVIAPVEFESDGSGWCYIESNYFPPVDADGQKSIIVSVKHNGRVDVFKKDNIPFKKGSRPDRVIDIRSINIIDEIGNESLKITPNSTHFRCDLRLFKSLDASNVSLALLLFATRINRSYRHVDRETNSMSFQLLPMAGTGTDNIKLDFIFSEIDQSVLRYEKVTASIVIATKIQGLRHARILDIGTFDVIKPAPLSIIDSSNRTPPPPRRRPRAKPSIPSQRYSGPHWCKKFPDTANTAGLIQPFRKNVQNFIFMLEKNGANVSISSAKRPKQRAYLMKYSFLIAKGKIKPSQVPKYKGVNIVWVHKNAKKAALRMISKKEGYNIAYQPSGISSRHCVGKAIDMTITNLPKSLSFKVDGKNQTFNIGNRSAAKNKKLHAIAKKYFKLNKLYSDPPHWYMK